MKMFWMGYVPLPISFLIFVAPKMGNPIFEIAFLVAVILSIAFLIFKRTQILVKKYQLLFGLLAGITTIAVGYILVFMLGFFASVIH
jgi:hypothetical protein